MKINMDSIAKELLDKLDQLIELEDRQARALFFQANTKHHYQNKMITRYLDANSNR